MGHNKCSAKRKTQSSQLLQKENGESLNSLTVHLKGLEQKESNIPKRNRQQEIIKLRAEINQIETIQRIKKTRSWLFEKINKTDKPFARLTRGHRSTTQTNKIRN